MHIEKQSYRKAPVWFPMAPVLVCTEKKISGFSGRFKRKSKNIKISASH